MTDYLITNVRVFVDKNSRGQYMWALGQLYYEEDEYMNPNVLPTYPIMREETVKKWLKCAVKNTELSKDGGRQVFDVKMEAVYKAIEEMHFADKEQTPCCKFIGGEKRKDDFCHIRRVEAFDVPLTGNWAKLALVDTPVKLTNGTTKTIPMGQPLVGKNGFVVPVTQIRVHLVVGLDGKPIENPQDVVNGILERRYMPFNPTGANIPTSNAAQPVQADNAAEEAQAAAEEAALGLPY